MLARLAAGVSLILVACRQPSRPTRYDGLVVQMQAASNEDRLHKTIAIVVGGVLALGLGVVLFKALSHSERE